MNRLIKVLPVAIILMTCTVGILVAQQSSTPNIVVILTDDQGYADFSFNPHHPEEVNTPNMDALATEGIYFSQAYISGNVCSPTRAGLLTGRYQQRAGVYNPDLPIILTGILIKLPDT